MFDLIVLRVPTDMLVYIIASRYVKFMIVFFFFQAEDGIRDHCVTGVQTCALPISPRTSPSAVARRRRCCSPSGRAAGPGSGERRVGEEGRSRGAPDHLKKKKQKNMRNCDLVHELARKIIGVQLDLNQSEHGGVV